jgi:hypothetical protein
VDIRRRFVLPSWSARSAARLWTAVTDDQQVALLAETADRLRNKPALAYPGLPVD